jgi:O-succinylbenzoic acid--CoA ligase
MTETGGGVVYDGIPLDGIEVRIADDEIHLRGPMLLRAYRDGTNPVDDDGWLATGDLGFIDDTDHLVVTGRKSDLIITGGENVWPGPVEARLREHPAIRDVAVVARPSPEWGEMVVALVVPEPGAAVLELAEIRGFVTEKLPPFAAPRAVEYRDHLPRTTLGKLRRADL